jgi:hypothetical protein
MQKPHQLLLVRRHHFLKQCKYICYIFIHSIGSEFMPCFYSKVDNDSNKNDANDDSLLDIDPWFDDLKDLYYSSSKTDRKCITSNSCL